MKITEFPGIMEVALEIGYDNGMINRDNTKREFLSKCGEILASVDETDLNKLEEWLQTLTTEERETLGSGDIDEAEPLQERSPVNSSGQHLTKLFEDIFESA